MSAVKILIVDDNSINITIAQVLLEADGHVVQAASSGQEALQLVPAFKPDLILMDIQMPGMDGLEVTRLLKADQATRDIRIVAFTAFAMQGDEAKLLAAGCDAYLSKPIDVKRFGMQVRAFLGS